MPISTMTAGSAYELYEVCDILQDLDQLHLKLEMAEETLGDMVRGVCKLEFPGPFSLQSVEML